MREALRCGVANGVKSGLDFHLESGESSLHPFLLPVFRSIRIKLSVSIVLPLLDLMRELAAAVEAAGTASANGGDLQILLDLFSPDFSNTGLVFIEGGEAPAVLRACACLRIELRRTKLAAIPDDTLESEKGLDPALYAGEEKRAVMCYLFMATIQLSLLKHFVAQAPPFSSAWRALKTASVPIGNLFRTRRTEPDAAIVTPVPGKAWEVVVLNDPINLMAYVTLVFQTVLGLSVEVAQQRMREVHEVKSSKVWVGPREKAEAHVRALQSWHLNAVLRPTEAT